MNSRYEYWDLVQQILETVEQGTFRVLSRTCPLDAILTSPQRNGPVTTSFMFSDVTPVHGDSDSASRPTMGQVEHGKSSLPLQLQSRSRPVNESNDSITMSAPVPEPQARKPAPRQMHAQFLHQLAFTGDAIQVPDPQNAQ